MMPKKLCGMDLNGGFEGKSRLISVYSIFFFTFDLLCFLYVGSFYGNSLLVLRSVY